MTTTPVPSLVLLARSVLTYPRLVSNKTTGEQRWTRNAETGLILVDPVAGDTSASPPVPPCVRIGREARDADSATATPEEHKATAEGGRIWCSLPLLSSIPTPDAPAVYVDPSAQASMIVSILRAAGFACITRAEQDAQAEREAALNIAKLRDDRRRALVGLLANAGGSDSALSSLRANMRANAGALFGAWASLCPTLPVDASIVSALERATKSTPPEERAALDPIRALVVAHNASADKARADAQAKADADKAPTPATPDAEEGDADAEVIPKDADAASALA